MGKRHEWFSLGAKRDWVYCNVSMSKNEGDLGYRSKKE